MIDFFSVPKHKCGKEVGMEGAKWMEIRNDRLKGMSYLELGKIPHRPTDSETVCRITAATRIHTVCAKTYKVG